MVSNEILDIMIKKVDIFCKIYTYDLDYIIKCAKEMEFQEYFEMLGSTGIRDICLSIATSKIKGNGLEVCGLDLYDILEEVWSFYNGINFLVNCSSIKEKNTKVQFKELFNKIENSKISDFVFDFSDNNLKNIAARLSKLTYKLKDSNEQIWTLSLYHKNSSGDFNALWVSILPSRLPRVFMWSPACGRCSSCTQKDLSLVSDELSLDLQVAGLPESTQSFKILSKVTQKVKCESLNEYIKETGYNFTDILDVVLFTLDKYINRKIIHKSISPNIEIKNKNHNTVESKYSRSETQYIHLTDNISFSDSRSATKHGTHASPKSHYRRGHWRVYKSGKRVWVKASLVNKGKAKVTYKID